MESLNEKIPYYYYSFFFSGMTYLSYFMKEEDSPGYYATLNWVKNQIPDQRINNFRVSFDNFCGLLRKPVL